VGGAADQLIGYEFVMQAYRGVEKNAGKMPFLRQGKPALPRAIAELSR
jgi:hypothetical protein